MKEGQHAALGAGIFDRRANRRGIGIHGNCACCGGNRENLVFCFFDSVLDEPRGPFVETGLREKEQWIY